jgi:hypothetical protein
MLNCKENKVTFNHIYTDYIAAAIECGSGSETLVKMLVIESISDSDENICGSDSYNKFFESTTRKKLKLKIVAEPHDGKFSAVPAPGKKCWDSRYIHTVTVINLN